MIALSYRKGYAAGHTRPPGGLKYRGEVQGDWVMLTKRILLAGAAAIGLGLGASQARAAEEVEIIHWWTSGGEAAALQVLRRIREGGRRLEGCGHRRRRRRPGPYRVAGPHGRGRSADRHADAGPDDPRLGRAGCARRSDPVAEKEGWDKVIPPALQAFDKYDGH